MNSRLLFFTAILFFCLPSYSKPNDDGCIKVDLHLYLWPASINGNVTAGNRTADTSMQFNDILRNLKMEANGAIKISKENWFLFNDFIYLNIAPKASENISSGMVINTTLDITTFTDMLAVGRQWQNPIAWNLFIGARYIYSRMQLDAAIDNIASLRAVRSKNWATPTIGAGIKLPLNDKLFFNFITAIGAASKSFNWEALPTLCWQFNTIFTAELGYRLLDIKYKKDDFKMDTVIHGPIIGLKISL